MDKARTAEGRVDLNVVIQTQNQHSWLRSCFPEDPVKTIVIGNGPSITEHISRGDFDLLADLQAAGQVETWSMNLIDLIYDRTDWRPSNWIWVEHITYDRALGSHRESTIEYAKKVVENHIVPGVEHCIIEERFRGWLTKWLLPMFPSEDSGINWISRCEGLGHGRQFGSEFAPADWHLPEICVYGGSMNTALPLVYMAGHRDVAVIGCDLGIEKPVRGPGNKWVDSNHFDPDYLTWMDGDYSLADDTLRDIHQMARKNFEADGRTIVNAGIGGELEVYDRVPLQEFLGVKVG